MNIGVTLFGQMLTFAIFVGFTMKFVWPAFEQVLAERKQKIADGLAAAEHGHQALEAAAEQAKVELQKARAWGNEIIAAANKQAMHIIEEARLAAQHERDDILASGRDMLKHELAQAQAGLRHKVADIVVLGAEKILARSINTNDHQALLNKLVQEMAG